MKQMEHFIYICNLFCLFPFKIVTNSKYTKYESTINKSYTIRQLIINICFVLFMLKKCYEVMLEKSLEKMVFTICTLINIAAVYEWCIYNYMKTKQFEQFLNEIEIFCQQLNILTKSYTGYINKNIIIVEIIFLTIYSTYLTTIYFCFRTFVDALEVNLVLTLPKMLIILKTFLFVNFILIFYGISKKLTNISFENNDNFHITYQFFLNYAHLVRKSNDLFGCQFIIHYVFYLSWNIYELFHFVILVKATNVYYELLSISYTILFTFVMLYWMFVCHITTNQIKAFQKYWLHAIRKQKTHVRKPINVLISYSKTLLF